MSKRFYYAQLNHHNQVVGKSDLAGELPPSPFLVKLTSLTDCLLGDVYQDGVFVTPAPEQQG